MTQLRDPHRPSCCGQPMRRRNYKAVLYDDTIRIGYQCQRCYARDAVFLTRDGKRHPNQQVRPRGPQKHYRAAA